MHVEKSYNSQASDWIVAQAQYPTHARRHQPIVALQVAGRAFEVATEVAARHLAVGLEEL